MFLPRIAAAAPAAAWPIKERLGIHYERSDETPRDAYPIQPTALQIGLMRSCQCYLIKAEHSSWMHSPSSTARFARFWCTESAIPIVVVATFLNGQQRQMRSAGSTFSGGECIKNQVLAVINETHWDKHRVGGHKKRWPSDHQKE